MILGRDALVELRTAAAEREFEKALSQEPTNVHALLGSFGGALLEGNQPLARRRFETLEQQGASPQLTAARALLAVFRREPGFRKQMLEAGTGKVDLVLVKTVATGLMARDGRHR